MTKLEKMALGRRAAYLKRCIRVAELLEMYETPQTVRKRVFADYIEPEIGCSYTTFNNMLNVSNPALELEKIMHKLNKKEYEEN